MTTFLWRTILNHCDRLKISASQLLFGKLLNLDRGIFLPEAGRLVLESRPLSQNMSQMLEIQDSLLKASAKELLRADLLNILWPFKVVKAERAVTSKFSYKLCKQAT